jgi:hypothetical protein
MGVIMGAKLTVKKENLESEVHYSWNGSSYKVLLRDATQDQLAILKELGMDVFEVPAKEQK